MRERDMAAKAPGETRVLALGDSFTFGVGVEAHEAWPRRLEALLNEQAGGGVLVLNGGGRERAKTALAFLRQTGPLLDPDLLVYQLYLGNDVYNALEDGAVPPDVAAEGRRALGPGALFTP